MTVRKFNRVPAEMIGLARGFRRCVANDLIARRESLLNILYPIRDRLERKPTIRRSKHPDIVRAWKALDSPYRLNFSAGVDQDDNLVIDEWRLDATETMHEEWQSVEPGVSVSRLRLTTNMRFGFSIVPLSIISLHCLARLIERTGKRDHAAIVEYMRPLIDADPESERVDAGIGTFLCEPNVMNLSDHRRTLILCCRTFMTREMAYGREVEELA